MTVAIGQIHGSVSIPFTRYHDGCLPRVSICEESGGHDVLHAEELKIVRGEVTENRRSMIKTQVRWPSHQQLVFLGTNDKRRLAYPDKRPRPDF